MVPPPVPATPQAEDLPLRVVGIGVLAIAAVLVLVPQVFGAVGGVEIRTAAAICVVVFAFFFVTVASRIVGLVGVTSNPTSGMTIAALLGTASIFLLFGWTDTMGKAAALTVGCVVAIAASISGDTSQDLKTGFLLGATPRRQQTAELIGVLTSAVFVCLTVLALGKGFGFGSTELPAPQATLMKLVIDGVLDQNLPWGLVAIGAGIAILCEIARIPSLPFAVGVYLPVSTMTPIFVGGLIRLWMERNAKDEDQAADRRERVRGGIRHAVEILSEYAAYRAVAINLSVFNAQACPGSPQNKTNARCYPANDYISHSTSISLYRFSRLNPDIGTYL